MYRVQITTAEGTKLTSGTVELQDGCFAGKLDISALPEDILELFRRHEQLVNDQVLSVLDEVEDQIAAANLRVGFEDGMIVTPHDLQIFPSERSISFRSDVKPTVVTR